MPVSDATVARLPTYLQCVIDLDGEGAPNVSSDHLAELAGVNPATLRRDLGSLGITGTRGVGYDTKYLVHEISVALGLNQEWPVVIVGVGNLGRALANYPGLEKRGFPVRALVDVDTTVVGESVAGITIEALDDLEEIVARERVAAGVLATPPEGAQDAADRLVAAGVTSLLNFTATAVTAPDSVVVRQVDLATELQILSFHQQRTAAVRSGSGLPLVREMSAT